MEQEYKWQASEAIFSALTATIADSPCQTLHMSAVYYDTPERWLSSQRAGLRIRQENEASVCCLKITESLAGGLAQRQEYEVPARDIHEGLEQLLLSGAPAALCRKALRDGVSVTCQVDFIRRAFLISGHGFVCELAMDSGNFNHRLPFAELEAELKSGDFTAFSRFCGALQTAHGLVPQSQSKLERALAEAQKDA